MQIRAGCFEVLPITVINFVDTGKDERSTSGRRKAVHAKEDKPKMLRLVFHYLYFRHVGSGLLWKFTGSSRNGEVSFSDGRNDVCDMGAKPKRLKCSELKAELARLVQDPELADGLVASMFGNALKGTEAREIIGPLNTEIDAAAARVKAATLYSRSLNR